MPADLAPRFQSRLTLVLGGARSGKSRYAEGLIEAWSPPFRYVATAQAFDEEMRERIALHRSRRDGRWRTIDAPHALADAMRAGVNEDGPVLVDCLTLWLTNMLIGDFDEEAEIAALLVALRALPPVARVVLVSNEVGMGIVPENPLARRFRDLQGRLNQDVAAIADRVVFVAAGLPLVLKGRIS